MLDPLIGFILGMQGSGGYYRNPDGTRRYPGLDLAGAVCASSLNHVNAKFPKLASCWENIGLVTTGNGHVIKASFDYAYDKLYCGMENLTNIDIMQKYIKSLSQKSVIGVQTGMSDGSIPLCKNEEGNPCCPNWSHLPATGDLSGLTSFPPRDIARFYSVCCSDGDELFSINPSESSHLSINPSESSHWSNSIYHFTRTLIHGCTGNTDTDPAYGNTRYIFENEVDVHYGGLGKVDYDNCVEDGWSNEITTVPQAKARGNHLVHHFMQAYFSFYQAIKDWNDENYPNHQITGYPSGISDGTLGLMVARWIYKEVDTEAAMKFSNIFYAEHPVEKLKKAGMNYAYPDDNYDSVPWPLSDSFEVGSTEIRRWKWDFGIPPEELESTNTTDSSIDKDLEKGYRLNLKAVCRAQFMDTFFAYIAEEQDYFDGFVVHYYSHWSRLPKVLEYLSSKIGTLKIIINELGSRQRLKEQKGYKCDKYLEYETGSRFISGKAEYRYDIPLHSTQAAEVARKYLTLAMEKFNLEYNIEAVQWEWFIKGPDIQSEKCALVQTCGQNPSLSGKRHPAFDAYAIIMEIFKNFRVESVGEYTNLNFAGSVKLVHFVNNGNPLEEVTAYWGFYDEESEHEYTDVYRETLGPIEETGHEKVLVAIKIDKPANAERMLRYNAVGKILEERQCNAVDEIVVPIDSSPQFVFWGEASMQYDPDEITTENYSQILIGVQNTGEGQIKNSCFDTNGVKPVDWEDFSVALKSLDGIQGFAWMDGGYLLVSNNSVNDPNKRCIHKFNGFTGEYLETLTRTSRNQTGIDERSILHQTNLRVR